MPWQLTVFGVDRTSLINQEAGVSVSLAHNERGTATFTTNPGYIPELRSDVVIYDRDGVTPIFGGVIFQRETRGVGKHTFAVCECADWTWYLDRLTIEGGETTGVLTLKGVLEWLQIRFAPYGFILDPAQATGPSASVTGFTWERKYASDVLRDLTSWTGGWVFQVDPNKVWRMVSPSLAATTAPFAISDFNSNARILEWQETSEHYATKVILRCGGTGTRESTQSWTVDAQILVDGYVETSAPSTPTGGVSATINGAPASIGPVGSLGTELIWNWETHRVHAGTYGGVDGDVIVLNYTAQYPFEVIADSGVVPAIELVESLEDMTDPATAQAMANGKLAAAYQSPRTFEIDSVKHGLRPGQVIGINSTHRSAVANALITAVSIRLITNDIWTYRATATTGVYTSSGLDFWRSLGGGVGGSTTPMISYTAGGTPVVGMPLTAIDDLNVTITMGGGHVESVLKPTSMSLGWQGTLGPTRLNDNVVQSVTNDSNVTGSVSAQNLTFGWQGQLQVPRGGTGLSSVPVGRLLRGDGVNPFLHDANLTFDAGQFHIGGMLNVTSTSRFGDNVAFAANANPITNYTSNLGALSNKYLTLHAAELWVETLVAQDTMATMGGRFIVPKGATILEADLAPGDTVIHVKHNNLSVGDIIWMESDGKFEMMLIVGEPDPGGEETNYFPLLTLSTFSSGGGGGGGPVDGSTRYWPMLALSSFQAGSGGGGGGSTGFVYNVTRNLDGTGANQWFAGDAVVNTGQVGDGFIEMYAYGGRFSGVGPSIGGNVRTGTTYNDIALRWLAGNLKNTAYSPGSANVYGFAAGNPLGSHIMIDDANGLRIRNGSTTKIGLTPAGDAFFNEGGTTINASGIRITPGTDGVYHAPSSYSWNVTNGDMGLYGQASGTVPFRLHMHTRSETGQSASRIEATGTGGTATLDVIGDTAGGIGVFEGGKNSAYLFTFFNGATSPQGVNLVYEGAAPNSTGAPFLSLRDSNALRAEFRSNGGLANFSANNVNLSDARAKTLAGPARSYRADFRRLSFWEGKYIDSKRATDDLMITAHEVEAIWPDLVEPFGSSGLKGVREQGLWMRGLQVLQEVDADVVQILQDVRALKETVAGLRQ
jgi:hypothetical protein